MAWYFLSRPCLAVPPAESPSTRKSSQAAGSLSAQSASLPGKPPPVSTFLRCTISLALRAACRAWAASTTLSRMLLASLGCSSRYCCSISLTHVSTAPRASALPSLVLVWPSNWGSATLMAMTAVRPSLKSSPTISTLAFSSSPDCSA